MKELENQHESRCERRERKREEMKADASCKVRGRLGVVSLAQGSFIRVRNG